MKRFKSALFLATVASMALATSAAQAQTQIPYTPGQSEPGITPADPNGEDLSSNDLFSLLGTGATSIQNVLAAECPYLANFQGNFSCTYEPEGSGFGRRQWRNATNQWTAAGLTNSSYVSSTGWVQFAFADSSVTPQDLDDLDNNLGGTAVAGIMVPKYVLPVAIAYNDVYGTTGSNVDLHFNVQNPKQINGVDVGGLQMSHETYCKVFNGAITNFNAQAFTDDNTDINGDNPTSLMDPADNSSRWTNDGVPIRLVGRVDSSGTTDIFTHALADQCDGITGLTNKFLNAAESLPYDPTNNALPDYSGVRPDTQLRFGASGPYAGTTNVISFDYYNGSAIVTLAGGTSDSVGTGKFIVAIGSGGVAGAINVAPDLPSPSLNTTLLNGKLGYVASDFVANSITGQGLFAAALENDGEFRLPSAPEAATALGTIAPPESTTGGVWDEDGDARQVRDPADTNPNDGQDMIGAKRNNPLAWYDVLYSATGQTPLSNPASGYPITGTTQFLGYRCYTTRNRHHIGFFLGADIGSVLVDQNGDPIDPPVAVFLAASNIGVVPADWSHAIDETFLKDSVEAGSGANDLGDESLWIQSEFLGDPNPTCPMSPPDDHIGM